MAPGQMSQTKGLWEIQARWENGEMGEQDRWESKKRVRGKGALRVMSKDMGDGKGVLCDSGKIMGAEWKGVVGIQWDMDEMWFHPGRRGLERVSLALAVGRDYMRSAGEEDVMSRSVSQGTLLLCGGQDSSSCRSFQLSTPWDSGSTFPHWKWHQRAGCAGDMGCMGLPGAPQAVELCVCCHAQTPAVISTTSAGG